MVNTQILRIDTTAKKLSNILRLISMPGGGDILFDKVSPTFHPNGSITIMAKSLGTFERLTFSNLKISGITEPIDLVLRCSQILDRLSIFSDTDEITFEHNDQEKTISIYNKSGRSVSISTKTKKEEETGEEKVHTIKESPFIIDPETHSISFKNGEVKPSIKASIPIDRMRDLIKFVSKVGIDPKIYRMEFVSAIEGSVGLIRTQAGDPKNRERDIIKDSFEPLSLIGSGKVAYGVGFEAIFINLEGFADIETVPGGPLWITQKEENYLIQYLLSPAAREFL